MKLREITKLYSMIRTLNRYCNRTLCCRPGFPRRQLSTSQPKGVPLSVPPSDPAVEVLLDRATNYPIHFTREGNKKSNILMVAVHGGPGSHRDFRHLCGEFKSQGLDVEVIRFDLPGYGESDPFLLPPTTSNYSDIITRSLNEIYPESSRNGLERKTVFVGHSMGSHIAIDLCSRYLQAKKPVALALLAPTCPTPGMNVGGNYGFWIHKLLIQAARCTVYTTTVLANRVKKVYTETFNFPSSISAAVYLNTYTRVALLDWAACSTFLSPAVTTVLITSTVTVERG